MQSRRIGLEWWARAAPFTVTESVEGIVLGTPLSMVAARGVAEDLAASAVQLVVPPVQGHVRGHHCLLILRYGILSVSGP